jgi:hypothetical protein
MPKLLLIAAGAALLVTATVTSPAWSQGASSNSGTCSSAYADCRTQTRMIKECETERQWCMQTGTFANPKTKTVAMGLRKK